MNVKPTIMLVFVIQVDQPIYTDIMLLIMYMMSVKPTIVLVFVIHPVGI